MSLVVPAEGNIKMLSQIFNATGASGDLTIKLYINDYTPTKLDNATMYTCMSTLTDKLGYLDKTLTHGTWTTPTLEGTGGANGAKTTYPTLTWVFNAGTPATVYGYYIVDSGGTVIIAERFASASGYALSNQNDQISITPALVLN